MLPGSKHVPLPGNERTRTRPLVLGLAIVISLSFFMFRLFSMQVFSGNEFVLQADGNRFRQVIEYAPRGKILDVNGHVLAGNTVEFQLSATPYQLPETPDEQAALYDVVASITKQEPSEIAQVIEAAGADSVLPVVIASKLSQTQALQLQSLLDETMGLTVDDIPIRAYDSRAGLAHLVGYVGRASEHDIEQDQTGTMLPTDFVGKTGIEASYDDVLRGVNGFQRIEVDALGRPVRVIERRSAIPGKDLQTSIDFETQKAMHDSMIEYMEKAESTRASGVAVDPIDGSVIAMVSLPAFDNNMFARGIEDKAFNELINDSDQPLFNKVISGGFTSGSIIKPLVAVAALEEDVVSESTVIVDRGFIDLPGEYGGSYRFRGWRPEGLGPMDVRSAIAYSSNIYFYTVGGGFDGISGLGEARLTNYYRQFGLGEATGINLPNETQGRVPDDAWKRSFKGEQWYTGDSYNISIGQGDLLISPLQITMAEAAIVNNGSVLLPKLLTDEPTTVRKEVSASDENFQIVREGMRQVLTDGTTCECTFSEVPVVVAGKSGTAETNTPDGKAPHAWFTAFAPYDDPEIVATVLVEEGRGGSAIAAPAVAGALEAYFNDD